MPETPKKKEPTASEAMFFFAIVKHTRNKADIDWSAVAAEQGFKNADVAKVYSPSFSYRAGMLIGKQVRFGQVKRKLGISTNTDTPATSRTPINKVASASAVDSPTKVRKSSGRAKPKGRAKGKGIKVEEVEDEELADDETVVGVKNEHLDGELDAEVGSFLAEEESLMGEEEPAELF
ncbi:hypothetical protein MAC_09578 [Metarhizium acridum CQMa 102]|uniref:Uncharacterized protein n=1 Tax=Metarhizium acridum (strain CQMa 102) TaxID=655827 RepID=E9EI80_METAQ|nr:uncharacterized protein MAC_09578 [Metarhizium acridum CQMa 102]EFY84378.1 hypothetical protein MAC_09578 [Metarhizium acridum CQMa 102]